MNTIPSPDYEKIDMTHAPVSSTNKLQEKIENERKGKLNYDIQSCTYSDEIVKKSKEVFTVKVIVVTTLKGRELQGAYGRLM